MEIEFQVTEEDYINWNLYHIENSPSQKRTYIFSRYASTILIFLATFIYTIRSFKDNLFYPIAYSLILSLVFFFTFKMVLKKFIIRQIKKLLKDGDNTSLFCKKTLSISENKIKIFDENSCDIITKKNINDIKIYGDLIIIYISSITAHIIPIRYLDDNSKTYLLKQLGYED